MAGILSVSLPAVAPTGWELGHNGRHRISQLAGSRTMGWEWGHNGRHHVTLSVSLPAAEPTGWEWGHNGRHLISQFAGSSTNRLGVGSQWQASYQSVCRQ